MPIVANAVGLVWQKRENKTVAVSLYRLLSLAGLAVQPLKTCPESLRIFVAFFGLLCSTYLLLFTHVSVLMRRHSLMIFMTSRWSPEHPVPSWSWILLTAFIGIDLCRVHISISPRPLHSHTHTHTQMEGSHTHRLSTWCCPHHSRIHLAQSAIIIRSSGHSKQAYKCLKQCVCAYTSGKDNRY